MEITALGYIGIKSPQLGQWSRMATTLLGMQQVDRGGSIRAFRMDDHSTPLSCISAKGSLASWWFVE